MIMGEGGPGLIGGNSDTPAISLKDDPDPNAGGLQQKDLVKTEDAEKIGEHPRKGGIPTILPPWQVNDSIRLHNSAKSERQHPAVPLF